MRRGRTRTPRRRAPSVAVFSFAALTLLGAEAAHAQQSALLVGARELEGLPRDQREQAQREIERVLLEGALSVQRSPLTVEQLALAVGCDVRSDACLVRLSRDVTKKILLVPKIVGTAPKVRVELRAISGRTGRVTVLAGQTTGPQPEVANERMASANEQRAGAPVSPALAALPVGPTTTSPRDGGPSQPARIVGVSTLSASAVMLAFGFARLVRSRQAADKYTHSELDTTEGVDRAHDLHDEASHDARIARGVLSGAAILGVSGVAALLWHRFTGGEVRRAPAVTAQISQQGAVFSVRGTWGTGS